MSMRKNYGSFPALRLPYFAVPRFLHFLDELPKTPSEKVQKAILRATGVSADTFDKDRDLVPS